MSGSYVVLPIDAGMIDWLKSMDFEIPDGLESSRNPTPAEVMEVVNNYKNMQVEYFQGSVKSLEITLRDSDGFQGGNWAILRIREFTGDDRELNDPLAISFDGGSSKELIIDILRKISKFCGSLVLVDQEAKPVFVT